MDDFNSPANRLGRRIWNADEDRAEQLINARDLLLEALLVLDDGDDDGAINLVMDAFGAVQAHREGVQ